MKSTSADSGSFGKALTVLCIAAAAVEFAATRDRLNAILGQGEIVRLNEDGTDYAVAYSDATSDTRWLLVSLTFQGQVEAAAHVANLSNQLKPNIILMVGMCMGMPEKNYPVGTVIVPNEIFSFDHQRLTIEGIQYRPHGERVDNGLYKLARLIQTDERAYRVVTDKALASASTKIEDQSAELVAAIERAFPDVGAFDMEGGGFYRAGAGKECLWIKAVADSGEHQPTTSAAQDKKRVTQGGATSNAIDFAVTLMRQYVASNSPPTLI